ncbi:MAG: HAD family hydrolase [Methanobacteriota archaeon]|nr:MAG: HAD family hydrolase [Euryarchaeota archaeon]
MTKSAPPKRLLGRVKGVVFDLDDTLVLSTVDYVRFKKLMIERMALEGEDPGSYDPTEGIIQLISRFRDSMEARGKSSTWIEKVLEELNDIMDKVEMERVQETVGIPGAKELLETIRERGIKIGVLTRGCESYATKVLELTGLLEFVDDIEGRNSKVPPKPHPEPYWRLVGRLGLNARDTVFVGDHHLDATCARAAGVPFIGVRTGDLAERELREIGSVEVFDSVADMGPWLAQVLDDSD